MTELCMSAVVALRAPWAHLPWGSRPVFWKVQSSGCQQPSLRGWERSRLIVAALCPKMGASALQGNLEKDPQICPGLPRPQHQSHSAQPSPGRGLGLWDHTGQAAGRSFPRLRTSLSGLASWKLPLRTQAPDRPFPWAWVQSPQSQGWVKAPSLLHPAHLPLLWPGPSS